MVISGVKDIIGSDKGTYRDGGIIDYHFDFSLEKDVQKVNSQKNHAEEHFTDLRRPESNNDLKTHNLTLYPHFTATPKAY